MEFIKRIDGKYIIKGSNNFVVSEEEKLKLEKNELVLKDVSSNNCQKETKKQIDEIDKELNANIKETKSVKKRNNK